MDVLTQCKGKVREVTLSVITEQELKGEFRAKRWKRMTGTVPHGSQPYAYGAGPAGQPTKWHAQGPVAALFAAAQNWMEPCTAVTMK